MPWRCCVSVQVSGRIAAAFSHEVRFKLQTQSRISGKAVILSVYVPRVPIRNMLAPKGADMTKTINVNPIPNLYLLVGQLYNLCITKNCCVNCKEESISISRCHELTGWLNKYLLNAYFIPGTLVGTRDVPVLLGSVIPVE